MAHSVDGSKPRSPEANADSTVSRRRPGRRDDVHPSLIPLLRGTISVDIGDHPALIADALPAAESMEAEKDNLASARGIMIGLGLSIPIWAVLILGAFQLLGHIGLEIVLSLPIWVALSLAACNLFE